MSNQNTRTDFPTPNQDELSEILNKYGYFLGIAYEDEQGNLATYPAGKVEEELRSYIDRTVAERLLAELDEVTAYDKEDSEALTYVRRRIKELRTAAQQQKGTE